MIEITKAHGIQVLSESTDKVQAAFEAWLSTLQHRPHTPAAYDWCLATWQASRTAALNEAIEICERRSKENSALISEGLLRGHASFAAAAEHTGAVDCKKRILELRDGK